MAVAPEPAPPVLVMLPGPKMLDWPSPDWGETPGGRMPAWGFI